MALCEFFLIGVLSLASKYDADNTKTIHIFPCIIVLYSV